MNSKKLSLRQVEAMKAMYMEYKSLSVIADTYGVSRSTVSWHINSKDWAADRKLSESEVFTSFTDAKKTDFIKMTQAAANILARSLQNLSTRHEPPTINEATRAADILKTLDNILRLDAGSPTDIVENQDKPMDSKELKKKLSVDPFADMEEEENENLN